MNRQVSLFLLLLFGISWGLDALLVTGSIPRQALTIVTWAPGVAGILTTLWFKRSAGISGLNFKNSQYLLAGYLLPLLYAVPVYLAIWLLGFAGVNKNFTCNYLVIFTLVQAQQIFEAAGGEIGWRGFLYPQLLQQTTGFNAALITGIVWAVWHFPLIVSNYHDGPPLWYVLSCFSLMIVSMSFIMAWLKDRSGSIWPSVLLQASHNLYILTFLNNLTSPTPYRAFIYGEYGLGLAISTLFIAVMLWIKHEPATFNPPRFVAG